MKKTILLMGGIALSILGFAQVPDSTKTPETTPPTQEVPATTPATQEVPATTPSSTTWDYKKNATVDSINAKYKDQLVAARPGMTTEQIFPVLGQYESTANADAPSVSITLDESNRGMVWVDGLPQGRIKALLRKSPSTYKIPAQKLEDGKDVAEGTLIFDKDANTLHIVIGRPYNVEEPMSVFSTPATDEVAGTEVKEVKAKKDKVKIKLKEKQVKAWTYTGTKVESTTAMSNQ